METPHFHRKRGIDRMGRVKGDPKTPGSGRKKGHANKITTQVRDMVMRAIEFKGGVEYFIWAAENEPRSFLALAAKCIPQAIEGSLVVEHTFKVRDFTALGEQNARQEEPEVIDIEAESTRIEPGTREEIRAVPIEAIDRGSIPVAVQSGGTHGPEDQADW